jgi:transposase
MKGEINRKSQIKALLNIAVVKLRTHAKIHFRRQEANIKKKKSISFRKACKQRLILIFGWPCLIV